MANVTVVQSPRWSAFGSMWPTIRHAITGFVAVGGAKVMAILMPAIAAMEGGDFSALKALNPKALAGAFIAGCFGAAFAAIARWVQILVTDQKVVK